VFHGSGCCAIAIDDSASEAAPTTAIRIPDKTVAINVPSPRKFRWLLAYPRICRKGNPERIVSGVNAWFLAGDLTTSISNAAAGG
jgi:hypothetical protein